MKLHTRLLHSGRQSAKDTQSVNPPLVRTSTVLFDDMAGFRQSNEGKAFESLRYGRGGSQTQFEIQQAMADIEQVESCLATSCGLSAITAVLTAFAGVGKHILVSADVYGPTRKYCQSVLSELGTDIEYYQHEDELAALIKSNTSLIFVETPSSLTMNFYNLTSIVELAKSHEIPLASDSTWGTPVFLSHIKLASIFQSILQRNISMVIQMYYSD